MAVILMGKNTMMRKAIRGHMENNPALEKLLPHIKGNVGFVFTKMDLVDVRNKILDNRVGASEATLLQMLKIYPFSYGLVVYQVYDSGTVFSPSVLDITDEDLIKRFMEGVTNIASVSLAIGYPTAASAPHSIINGFKNLLAIAAVTDITFKEAEQMKAILADPEAFAAAAAAAAPSAAPAAEEKKEEKKEESEEESDDDMGFGLFD